jgi:hypothetical protein
MTIVDLEQVRETEEPEAPAPRWEIAECTCPDPCCERDHEQD